MERESFEAFKFSLSLREQQVVEPVKDSVTEAIDGFFEKADFRREFKFDAPEVTPDPHRQRLRSERPEPEGELFFKKFGDSRRKTLRGWIARRLATGETLKALVDHASRYDRAEAALIDELGREVLAEAGA